MVSLPLAVLTLITGANWNREYLNHAIDLPTWYREHANLSDSELIQAYRSTLIEACQQKLLYEWGITTADGQW